MSGLLVLIDFDRYVYSDGVVADSQAKQELGIDKDWEKANGKEAVRERLAKHDYKNYALGNVKHSLLKILDAFPDRKGYRLFIGGKGNYRDSIATIRPYKGQRDRSSRPKYYSEMREYLQHQHGAELSDGREADDEVSILQWADKEKGTIIVSADKDLHNTPGRHYNPVKQEMSYVTKREADLNWIGQVATGDPSDNIPGLHLFGKAALDKLLSKCNNDARLVRKEIEALYKKQYGTKAQDAFHETASLVWIQRDSWINYDGSRIEKPTAPPTTEETPAT